MSGTDYFLSSLGKSGGGSFSGSWFPDDFINSKFNKGLGIKTFSKGDNHPLSLIPNKLVMIDFSDTWDVPGTFIADEADVNLSE